MSRPSRETPGTRGVCVAPTTTSALLATTLVQVTAALIINAMPAIVSALTSAGRLSPATAGYVVGIDLAAQVVGTVLFLSYGRRVRWTVVQTTGILLMVAGNLLSCISPASAPLFVSRSVAGVGAGVVRSACFVAFARAANPARAIAGLNVAQILAMAAAVATFPWISERVGWFGPYLSLALLGVLAFATAPWWPKVPAESEARSLQFGFGPAGAVCLAAVFVYFLAQSGVFAFAEAIGGSVGQPAANVNLALEFSAFAGVAASIFAFAMTSRLTTTQSLFVGLLISLLGLFLMVLKGGFWVFAIGLGLFVFSWGATTPFEFAVAAAADSKGNTAAAFSASDGLGLAAGPAVAGVLVEAQRPLMLSGCAAVGTLVSVLLFAYVSNSRRWGAHMRRT